MEFSVVCPAILKETFQTLFQTVPQLFKCCPTLKVGVTTLHGLNNFTQCFMLSAGMSSRSTRHVKYNQTWPHFIHAAKRFHLLWLSLCCLVSWNHSSGSLCCIMCLSVTALSQITSKHHDTIQGGKRDTLWYVKLSIFQYTLQHKPQQTTREAIN